MGLTRLDGFDSRDDNDPMSGFDSDKIKSAMMDMIKAAVEEVTTSLMLQAIRAMVEERTLGVPGPEFELFNHELCYYLKINPANRLELILAGKLVFLLATAYTMLGEDTIDPSKQEFPDLGPRAGTADDPRNK